MEELNTNNVSTAVNLFMSYNDSKTIEELLKAAGVTAEELELAKKMATRNLFSLAFGKRWTPEGIMAYSEVKIEA